MSSLDAWRSFRHLENVSDVLTAHLTFRMICETWYVEDHQKIDWFREMFLEFLTMDKELAYSEVNMFFMFSRLRTCRVVVTTRGGAYANFSEPQSWLNSHTVRLFIIYFIIRFVLFKWGDIKNLNFAARNQRACCLETKISFHLRTLVSSRFMQIPLVLFFSPEEHCEEMKWFKVRV